MWLLLLYAGLAPVQPVLVTEAQCKAAVISHASRGEAVCIAPDGAVWKAR